MTDIGMPIIEEALSFSWRSELPLVFLLALGMMMALIRFNRHSRLPLQRTSILFFAGLLGQFVAGFLHAGGLPNGAHWIYELSVVISGIALIRLASMLVFRWMRVVIKVGTPQIVEDLVTFLCYFFWLIIRLRSNGLDPSSLLASTAILTAVVAFSMQDTLGNLLGGLVIQLDNSVALGDWIRIDDVIGRVVDIRWRSCLIETTNGETVVVPNSQLMKQRFRVLGREHPDGSRSWRRHVNFQVDLGVPPTRVIPIIERAIREAEIAHVSPNPTPNCVLLRFEDGYGVYDLRYWLDDPGNDDPADSQVRIHIYTALQRAGLRLAIAEHAVRMTEETADRQRMVREREIERRLSALRRVELFSGLSPNEMRVVAERLTYSPFAQGETISREGTKAHWLYLVISGTAEVNKETNNGTRYLGLIEEGGFFGEAGLLTGEPRSATVVARTNMECYRLDKDGFITILEQRPALAEQISDMMVVRQSRMAEVLAEVDLASHQEVGSRSREMLSRIRHFFGLGTPSGTANTTTDSGQS